MERESQVPLVSPQALAVVQTYHVLQVSWVALEGHLGAAEVGPGRLRR